MPATPTNSKRPYTRFTEAEAKLVIASYLAGESVSAIGRLVGRDEAVLRRLLLGKIRRWAHLAPERHCYARLRLFERDKQAIRRSLAIDRILARRASPKRIARELDGRVSRGSQILRSKAIAQCMQFLDAFEARIDRSAGPMACHSINCTSRYDIAGEPPERCPGRIFDGKRSHRSHVLAYELNIGPLLPGHRLVHKNTSPQTLGFGCANFLHWEQVPFKNAEKTE